MSWHHLNFLLGLKKLGHDVFYMEDSDDYDDCCFDPVKLIKTKDPGYGLNYATEIFNRLGFKNQWAYFDYHMNRWHGNKENIKNRISDADILINVSMINPMREWFQKIPIRIAID